MLTFRFGGGFVVVVVVSFCTGRSLMSKDSLPSQSTTLEALLRGEGLDRRNNSKNDEESLLEIQVRSVGTAPSERLM